MATPVLPKNHHQILDEIIKQIYTTNGTGLTQDQISQILSGTSTVPLTPQEEKELSDLKVQHSVLIKAAKLAAFKKLHPEMRQFVINNIDWEERVKDIESTTAEKPARMEELERRDRRLFVKTGSTWYGDSVESGYISTRIRIPEGLTVDDLRQAHAEACLEEEVLDGKEV